MGASPRATKFYLTGFAGTEQALCGGVGDRSSGCRSGCAVTRAAFAGAPAFARRRASSTTTLSHGTAPKQRHWTSRCHGAARDSLRRLSAQYERDGSVAHDRLLVRAIPIAPFT